MYITSGFSHSQGSAAVRGARSAETARCAVAGARTPHPRPVSAARWHLACKRGWRGMLRILTPPRQLGSMRQAPLTSTSHMRRVESSHLDQSTVHTSQMQPCYTHISGTRNSIGEEGGDILSTRDPEGAGLGHSRTTTDAQCSHAACDAYTRCTRRISRARPLDTRRGACPHAHSRRACISQRPCARYTGPGCLH